MSETLTLIYHTAKVRLGFLIAACAMAGLAVSSEITLSGFEILVLGLAVLAASSASGAFNQLWEKDLDAQMGRTRDRPFVTGRFRVDAIWLSGILAVLVASLAAATWVANALTAFYIFLGAFTYGVIYTVWLKRRTSMNIVIGGLSGSFAVLAGAAAVGASLEPAPLILAVVLFLWTPPHFWALAFACQDDYRAARVPMLPVVVPEKTAALVVLLHAIALVVLSLLPAALGMGWLYLAAALSGGLWFIYACLQLYREPGVPNGWKTFTVSIVQLGLLLTGSVMDRLLLG